MSLEAWATCRSTSARRRRSDRTASRSDRADAADRARAAPICHWHNHVRIVLAQDWPVDPQKLGVVRVNLARIVGLDVEIAIFTGLDLRTVRARLQAAHGNSTLAKTFRDRWPSRGAAAAIGDEDDETNWADREPRTREEQTENDQKRQHGGDLDALRLDPKGAWSRPRQLATVLKSLDWEVPGRLRTPRFQSLIAHLSGLGVAMRPADAEEPFPQDADSPGIAARVCLRITQGSDPKLQRPRLLPEPLRREPGARARVTFPERRCSFSPSARADANRADTVRAHLSAWS